VASLGLLLAAFWARADIPIAIKPTSVGLGGFSYWSGGPFADTARTGSNWIEYDTNWGTAVHFYNTNGTLNPQFNTRGLPNYLNPGKKLRVLLWPYAVNRPTGAPVTWPDRGNMGVGRWVVTWQGDADIRLNGATFVPAGSSGPSTGSLVNGRRVYTMGSNPTGHITIEAVNPDNPVTDLKVWLPDPADPQNASLEHAASMWHPKFLATLAAGDFNHLRFMDWGETNQSPQQDWTDRRLPARVFQHGALHRRSPAEGIVWYTDGSGQPVFFSGDRNTGMAFEYMVDLCNTADKDLWICVPHLATDDFVTKLAQLIAFGSDGTNPYTTAQADPVFPPLNAHLKVYLEYSNEIWSNGNSFPQGNWAQAQADALGISKAQFNARRFSQVWSIFQSVFGSSARIVRCAAIWTGSDSYTLPFLNELRTYGPTLSPAVSPDLVSPTTYFGNGIQDWAYERATLQAGTSDPWFHTTETFVHNASTGATRPVSVPLNDPYWSSAALANHQAATFAEWKRRIFSGSTAAGGGPDSTGIGGGFSASLQPTSSLTFGQHLPIIAYEGGPSLYSDYLDGGDARDDGITNFNMALNRQPGFAEIYRIQLEMARAKGLASHSLFTDVGLWSKFGQWGHLEYPDQPPSESVKWTTVRDWAADAAALRPIHDMLGTRPAFSTAGTLPIGLYNTLYLHDILVSGGEGIPRFTVIGSLLVPGLSLVPVPGDPARYRITGTPSEGGWNYFYLRVQDEDGDASWRVFSLYIAGGRGTLLEADIRGSFSGASSLPWTQNHTLDPATTWSGLGRGAANASGNGSATGTDGTGVTLYSSTDALRFSVSQGAASESDSTLASAIADNEYWTFTVTPQPGKPLNLRNALLALTWRRETYHAPRNLAVFTSVGGFASGQQIYTAPRTALEASPLEVTLNLPDTADYENLTAPLTFRIYFYGSQYGHQASLLGLKLTRHPSTFPPIPTPLESWTASIDWLGTDSSPSAVVSPLGVSNLTLYAHDINDPFAADTAKLPRATLDHSTPGGPWFTFTYRENQAATDLTYTLRSSTNLSTWTDLTIDNINVIEEAADPDPDGDGSAELVRIRVKIDPDDTRRFLKLGIELRTPSGP
jgi:hypothetical protein